MLLQQETTKRVFLEIRNFKTLVKAKWAAGARVLFGNSVEAERG